jgi:hypothetical protein
LLLGKKLCINVHFMFYSIPTQLYPYQFLNAATHLWNNKLAMLWQLPIGSHKMSKRYKSYYSRTKVMSFTRKTYTPICEYKFCQFSMTHTDWIKDLGEFLDSFIELISRIKSTIRFHNVLSCWV